MDNTKWFDALPKSTQALVAGGGFGYFLMVAAIFLSGRYGLDFALEMGGGGLALGGVSWFLIKTKEFFAVAIENRRKK